MAAPSLLPPAPPCKAKSSRTGKPCRKYAIRGGTVCRTHGGAAPQVEKAAAQRVRDMLAEAIDPDRWMREVAAIAYLDYRELFDDKGDLRPVKEWPDHIAAAIAGVDVVVTNLKSGDRKTELIVHPRTWSKEKALEMLGKLHGKLKEQLEVSGGVSLVERLAAGRARVARERKRA